MRRCLMRQPFAQIALVDPRGRGQFRDSHRALGVQRFVEPERVTDMDQRDTRRAAEIAEHLTHELVQFIHVDVGHDCLLLRCGPRSGTKVVRPYRV
jgi:hypothetical protein